MPERMGTRLGVVMTRETGLAAVDARLIQLTVAGLRTTATPSVAGFSSAELARRIREPENQ
jgi:hypothetical protein